LTRAKLQWPHALFGIPPASFRNTLARDMTAAPNSPPRKRRWLQFSLRTLLIVMLVVGAICGWIGNRLQRARHQEQVVEQLTKLGASVCYDFEWEEFGEDPLAFTLLDFESPRTPPGPKWLRSLVGDDCFRRVVGVHFDYGGQSDEVAQLAGTLDDLVCLTFGLGDAGYHLTDAGLAKLGNLRKLEQLEVDNCAKITNDGLRVLRQLTNLERLVLLNTDQIDQSGLRHIAGLTKLHSLVYRADKFDEQVLGELGDLKLLQRLVLFGHLSSTRALATLAQFPLLEELTIYFFKTGHPISPQELAGVRRLTKLKKLTISIREHPVTYDWLHEIPNLEELSIFGEGEISLNDAFPCIVRLVKLRKLSLNGAGVTSDAIAQLVGVKTLEVLDLRHTRIGDRAVPYLQEMKQLKELYLPQPISPDSRRWHLEQLPMLKDY
jgi:hypothetical protein